MKAKVRKYHEGQFIQRQDYFQWSSQIVASSRQMNEVWNGMDQFSNVNAEA